MRRDRHVLFATDLGDKSAEVGARAVEAARCLDGDLTMVHVIEYFPEDEPVETIAPEDQDPESFLVGRARKKLAALARRLGSESVNQRVIVSRRSAGHAIAEVALAEKVNLIVLGRGAPRSLSHPLRSTVTGILSHVECDVLLVGPG